MPVSPVALRCSVAGTVLIAMVAAAFGEADPLMR